MEKFMGTWRLESSDKFDEYMKAIGVGLLLRKIGNTVKPDLQFEVSGEGAGATYTVKTISTFKNSEISFRLNEEFEETTIDDRKVKSTVTLDDTGAIVHKQAGDPETTVVRKVQEDGKSMVCTITAKDVVCTRVYRKLN